MASAPMRVATYNIRQSGCDRDTPNAWDARKADLVALVRKIAPDVFGCQEVLPDQAEYLRETLTEFDFAGEHRNKDRVSGEAPPVLYRKDRFEALDGGTFWLSETPDVPGVFLTIWSDSTRLVTNYGDAPFDFEGRTVPPLDFLLLESRGE